MQETCNVCGQTTARIGFAPIEIKEEAAEQYPEVIRTEAASDSSVPWLGVAVAAAAVLVLIATRKQRGIEP